MTGDWLSEIADVNMPHCSPSEADVAEMLPGLGGTKAVVTADTLLEKWRSLYSELLGDG